MIVVSKEWFNTLSRQLQQCGIRLKYINSERSLIRFVWIRGNMERHTVISEYDMPETQRELCDMIEDDRYISFLSSTFYE